MCIKSCKFTQKFLRYNLMNLTNIMNFLLLLPLLMF